MSYSAAPYCAVGDLRTGDLTVSSKVDKQQYVDMAAEEMDSYIGHVYVLPLTGLNTPTTLMLKRFNSDLASGQLILNLAAAAESDSIRNFAWTLINGVRKQLVLIQGGTLQLPDAPTLEVVTESTGPTSLNPDATSAVDSFETMFMRWHPYPAFPWVPGWQPGADPSTTTVTNP